MQVSLDDAEAGLFDNGPEGVHDDVQELNVADSAAVKKLRSGTLFVFLAEIVLIVCIVVVLFTDDVPDSAIRYLIAFIVIAALFCLIKLVLFYCLAQARHANRTEWDQIGV